MSEEQLNPRAVSAVELAIAAAGQRDNGWRRRVYDNVAEISTMLREGSEILDWASKIQEAYVFKATFTGFTEEIPEGYTRPTRLIVHTQSDQAIREAPGPRQNLTGEESTRTEPLWTKAGRLAADKLRTLPVGSLILCYKFTEQVNADQKVRVLVHFEVLRSPAAGEPSSQPAAGTSRPEGETAHSSPPVPAPESAPSAPEPHSPEDSAAIVRIEALFEQLDARQRVAYRRLCNGHGIKNPMVPEPQDVEQAIQFLADLGGEHG